jgi:hypothetical protein
MRSVLALLGSISLSAIVVAQGPPASTAPAPAPPAPPGQRQGAGL